MTKHNEAQSPEVVIDRATGQVVDGHDQPTGFAIDLMSGDGIYPAFVGAPERGKMTTVFEVDQTGPDGEHVDYPIVHIYSDFNVGDIEHGPEAYDSLVGMLRDVVEGLDHPLAREAYLGGQADRVERAVQATGPEGETVSEDAR